jgi:hypothetical protein
MKKLFLPFVVFAMTFAACEKEKQLPLSTELNMKKEVADLIQKGDLELYEQLYGTGASLKAPKPSIKITHGVFHIPPPPYGPADGYCLPGTSVCHITIVFPALVTPETPETIVTSSFSNSFATPSDGELIINNNGQTTTIEHLKSMSVAFSQQIIGQSTFHYSVF